MRSKTQALAALTMIMMLSWGCAQLSGQYYLNSGDYDQGIRSLERTVAEDPADAASAYWLGRLYLAKEEPARALPHLEKAAKLAPTDADYHFWLGVARWGVLDYDGERAAYLDALKLAPRHVGANLYLGHNHLDRGEWDAALTRYDIVLKYDPYNPEALYDRARALDGLGRGADAVAARKAYLDAYPDGVEAFAAVERLNEAGDYSWRNYLLGTRRVTLYAPAMPGGSTRLDEDSRASLRVLAEMMQNQPNLSVHIVAYSRKGVDRARLLAANVRQAVLAAAPGVNASRLPASWFGQGEVVVSGSRRMVLDESVNLITVSR